VEELLSQIAPTEDSDKIVRRLASRVEKEVRGLLPEAEVSGFAFSDLTRGTAYGVAVPEVDIVVTVSPEVLSSRLRDRHIQHPELKDPMDERKLTKSAIRACADRLVATGHFKFRRSAFRCEEPKVTLLAMPSLGLAAAVPVSFSVNSKTPLRAAALLRECSAIEPRTEALVLLIKRWAKDRGICHAAKGHLSPYLWTLLAVYFLQVGATGEEGSPLLPPLLGFSSSSLRCAAGSGPSSQAREQRRRPREQPEQAEPAVAELVREFLHIYARRFDFRSEAVSVRLGRRAAPHVSLPLHVVLGEDGVSTQIGISIEDPLDRRRNLGDGATPFSLRRLREELGRGAELLERSSGCDGASLARLLEPWAPPAAEVEEDREI